MAELTCRDCGVVGGKVFLEQKPPHTGIYCGECGAWIKWASAKEVRMINFKNSEAQNGRA